MPRDAFTNSVTLTVALAILACGGCKKKASPYPDLTEPKAAAVTFARALETDDVKVAQDASMAGGVEVELVEAMTHATAAFKQLSRAAVKKFGEAAVGEVLRAPGTIDTSEALAKGDVAIEGERATVSPADGKVTTTIPLQLVDGNWKVDIGALIKGEDVVNSIPVLRALAATAREMAAAIESGKYATAEEMKKDLQVRLGRVMSGIPDAAAPTSLPALLPSSAPPG